MDTTKAKTSLLFIRLNANAASQSSKPETYSIENPEYQISEKEVSAVADYEATVKAMKWSDEKVIAESVQNFNNTFYYQKRTDDEVEADVLDWDLGLPAENRKLEGSARENKKVENIAELKKFFEMIRNKIATLSDEDLRTLRINSLIGITSYFTLLPYLEKNSEIDNSFFTIAVKNHVYIRELVIDEMLKRGIDL